MHCDHCQTKSVIEIRMTVGGEELAFRRCGRCEAKGWAASEQAVALGRVLELARPGAR